MNDLQAAHLTRKTMNRIQGLQDPEILQEVAGWGDDTASSVLSKIHPGIFSWIGKWTMYIFEIIIIIVCLPVIIYLAFWLIKLATMCMTQGCSGETIMNLWLSVKACLTSRANQMTAEIQRAALPRNEANDFISAGVELNMRPHSEALEDLILKTNKMQSQILALKQSSLSKEQRIQQLTATVQSLSTRMSELSRTRAQDPAFDI